MNLFGKLYYVYHVYPPTEDDKEFVDIRNCHDDFLDCSDIRGIFTNRKEATKFANKLEKQLGIKSYD